MTALDGPPNSKKLLVLTLTLIELFNQSLKCKRITVAKRYCDPVIDHYASSGHPHHFSYAERMLNCSPEILMRLCSEITPEGVIAKTSIENARWCHCRQCPLCQFAKASKQRAVLFKAFAATDLTVEKYAFLTLTQNNVPLNQLRVTLKNMSYSWHKLYRRRTFPAVGFLRSMEVTMQRQRMPWDTKKNTGPAVRSEDDQLMAHPHFHILLDMEEDYFERGFKTTEWFVGEWRSALKADYNPIVHIKKVKAGNDEDFSKALLETCKYTVKPADFANDLLDSKTSKIYPDAKPHGAEWLYGITEQLDGLRSLGLGGTIKKFCNEEELHQIEDTGRANNEQSQFGKLVKLTWDDTRRSYNAVEVNDEVENGR